MSFPHKFNPIARAELEDAVDEYEAEQRGLGLRFAVIVEEAIQQICDFPESAPRVRGDIRKKVISVFPYSILYTIRFGEVRILAVAHQHRQPFYWVGRL